MVNQRGPVEGDELMQRIRDGDRAAAADFAIEYGPLIRRRVRGKLGPRLRRICDSLDIVSTVLRRLDAFVASRQVQASDQRQLGALIMTIAQNAVIDKARLLRRLEACESNDAALARMMLDRARVQGGHDEMLLDLDLERAVLALDNDVDQTILWMWLTGLEHRFTAAMVGLSEDNVRKRWQRIRTRLRGLYEELPT